MDRFRDMPETKDDIVTHLHRIFAFVDRYVDNYSSERVQKGIVDQFFNIRVKILQIIPDQYLCILLFKTMRRREHAVTQLAIILSSSIFILSLETRTRNEVNFYIASSLAACF